MFSAPCRQPAWSWTMGETASDSPGSESCPNRAVLSKAVSDNDTVPVRSLAVSTLCNNGTGVCPFGVSQNSQFFARYGERADRILCVIVGNIYLAMLQKGIQVFLLILGVGHSFRQLAAQYAPAYLPTTNKLKQRLRLHLTRCLSHRTNAHIFALRRRACCNSHSLLLPWNSPLSHRAAWLPAICAAYAPNTRIL
mgnify:CR=1 FL=1